MAKQPEKSETGPSNWLALALRCWIPLVLAVVTFSVYAPSLKSGFVYDAHIEILEEGFITSFSNLPAVLSLKVLGMPLILGSRPGDLLYLMLIAAVCGNEPFGYHLCNNLLHAANVALLFVLLRRLIAGDPTMASRASSFAVRLATVTVTLIFALHPISVEPVAVVSYSSDLLVTFFTLVALIAATFFRADHARTSMITGSVATFSAFAAVTCKESGVATALLLVVYWFLFRRREPRTAWFGFLGAALFVAVAFLAARFFFAPPIIVHLSYLGGSFWKVCMIQPRLWVFMMSKLLWPVGFSGDYTLENLAGLTTLPALVVLAVVVLLQGWLAMRNRIGATGVAVFWLGLLTVSNFMPLNRIMADRFYYLPLAGVAMQLLALLVMTPASRPVFWVATVSLLLAVLPLTLLTVRHQKNFTDQFSFWSKTLQVSPFSWTAYNGLGVVLSENGQTEKAIDLYQRGIELAPDQAELHYNLGRELVRKGRLDAAVTQFRTALELRPDYFQAWNNLGFALVQKGKMQEAITQFQKALEINPAYADARRNLSNACCSLGVTSYQDGNMDEAIAQFKKALEISPDFVTARDDLANAYNAAGVTFIQQGQVDDAIVQFKKALEIDPNFSGARDNLTRAQSQALGMPTLHL